MKTNNFYECPKCKRIVPMFYHCPWCEWDLQMEHQDFDIFEYMVGLQTGFQMKYGFHVKLHLWASAMAAEAGELWGASGGKWWKKKQVTDEERLEELVDLLHFFLGYMIDGKISVEQLFKAYIKKLNVNYKRQEQGY